MRNIKFLILPVALLWSAGVAWSQDIIILKNAEEIKALVLEVGISEVKYKRYENASGPTYTLLKSDIFMIKYGNRTSDTFGQTYSPATVPPQGTADENRSAPSQAPARPQPDANGGATVQSALPVRSGDGSLLSPAPVKEENTVRFGIHAGVVMSNMNSVDYRPGGYWGDRRVSPKFGFSGGILLDIQLAKVFSLQPGLSFTMKGCLREGYADLVSVDDETVVLIEDAYKEEKLSTSYLELPFHFVFNIPVKKSRFNIGIGPYAAYGIAGTAKNHYTHNGESVDDRVVEYSLKQDLFSGEHKRYNPLDYGLTGFLGFTFPKGFLIRAGYSHGLANISSDTEYLEENVKNNYFYFSMGVKF
jgi:hypothetical protein